MEIRLLGSLEVADDLGCLVAVRGSRLTTLLTALALRCGEVVTDDRLSEILWGDDPPHGANALQRQISTLAECSAEPTPSSGEDMATRCA